MTYFNFNGKILDDADNIIGPANRGLRYGDGVFETMKLKNGQLILSDEHFFRLWKGMQLLQFEIPKLFTPEKATAEILALTAKNKLTSARVRMTILRSDGGIYDPKNNLPNYIIETLPLAGESGSFNTNGLQLCLYRDAVKSIDRFSNIKHNNYLPYFMGAIFAKQNKCNDALILNSKGNICDSTIANVFVIKDGTVYTPALTEGCVAGVMRKWLTEKILEAGYEVTETAVTHEFIADADELFLSNSVYNIRWVAGLEGKSYSNIITQKIAMHLSQQYPAVFC